MQYIPGNLTSTWGASVATKIREFPNTNPKAKVFEAYVACYPLYSLMLATNFTKIDLLSLDVEGAELDVLKTIPWESVQINVSILCLIDSSCWAWHPYFPK